MERGMLGGVAPISMPALHVIANATEEAPSSLQHTSTNDTSDWNSQFVETGRCNSSLSNYSGRTSPFQGSSLRRHRSSASSLAGWSGNSSSQILHDLRHAAMLGRADAVTRILDTGVAVDQTLRMGWTALMYAASAAQANVVSLLLQRNANPNAHKELFTPLMAACSSSVQENKKCAGDDKQDVSTITTSDIEEKDSESRLLMVVELLVSHGADVNATERHRLTPLMFASKNGRAPLVRFLLKAGALPNLQDKKGWSALCWGCQGGHSSCVSSLLSAGADASLNTSHGETASDIARRQKHYKLAEMVEAASLSTPIGPASLPYQGFSDSYSQPDVTIANASVPESLPALQPQQCNELDMVLVGLNLSHLCAVFARHKVDLAGFLRLTAAELNNMGVSDASVQRRLLTAIAEMHRKAWQPTSLAPLSDKPFISLVDAISMLGNVNKHVTFLEATLAFLRQQLECDEAGKHLHHNTTNASITTLVNTANETSAAISRLQDTSRFLSHYLRQLSQCSAHLPSDLLGSQGPDEPRIWRRSVTTAAVLSSLALAVIWGIKPSLLNHLFALRPQGDSVLLDC